MSYSLLNLGNGQTRGSLHCSLWYTSEMLSNKKVKKGSYHAYTAPRDMHTPLPASLPAPRCSSPPTSQPLILLFPLPGTPFPLRCPDSLLHNVF